MDDDLNISRALGSIFDFINEVYKLEISKENGKTIIKTIKEFDKVLGLSLGEKEELSKELRDLIDKREEARKKKDYKKSDELRELLKQKGIVLEDTKEGIIWKKI